MITVPAGVRIHLALGATDMRKGFDGLALYAIARHKVEIALHGSSTSSCCTGCPSTILVSTSCSQANGSMPLSFAVSTSEATIAQRLAPPSLPANNAFLRPSAIGRIERSTGLVSRSMRPSSRNRLSAVQRRCCTDRFEIWGCPTLGGVSVLGPRRVWRFGSCGSAR